MDKIIYVYKGPGVGPIYSRILFKELSKNSKSKVLWIDENQLANSDWDLNSKSLVIPGGRDIYYHNCLKGDVNKRIIQYVKNGGCYIGICAGAYYGAAFLEFDVGLPLEVTGERELKFFPGIARGPAYGYGSYSYSDESGGKVSRLKTNDNKLLYSYFNGGCYFVDANKFPQVEVIANYDDIEGSPAAVVQCRLGKGKAILCGVHPEVSSSNFKSLCPFFQKHKEQLLKVENERAQLFKMLFCS